MQISVRGKQLDVGDALRSYVEENLAAIIGKYFAKPIEANVVLSRERSFFRADVSVHPTRGILVQSHSTESEAYAAVDTAMEKIAKRLRRYKRRLVDDHRNDIRVNTVSASYNVLDDRAGTEDEEEVAQQPVVVAELTTDIATLTVSEAVMRMDLADKPALLFHNIAHGGLNMVYRRTDGNIGWIDPVSVHSAQGGL